jgi:diguanylate cyclase
MPLQSGPVVVEYRLLDPPLMNSPLSPNDAAPVRRVALPWLGLALALGAAGLAAVASGLWILAQGTVPVWLAPAAAALAVLVAAVPAAWLMQRVAQAAPGGAALAAASLNTPIGTQKPLFLELAGREWTRARRYGTGAALLLVDVDRFARLVESRGGPASDAVLAELLRLTGPTLRGADLLTRFSEAQMAVFLAQSDATGALDVAERIRERAEQMEVPLQQEGGARRLRVTVSVGVAQLRPAHLNLQALIDDAQDAVVAARQAGGNCVRAAPVEVGRFRASGPSGPSGTPPWRGDHRARPQ